MECEWNSLNTNDDRSELYRTNIKKSRRGKANDCSFCTNKNDKNDYNSFNSCNFFRTCTKKFVPWYVSRVLYARSQYSYLVPITRYQYMWGIPQDYICYWIWCLLYAEAALCEEYLEFILTTVRSTKYLCPKLNYSYVFIILPKSYLCRYLDNECVFTFSYGCTASLFFLLLFQQLFQAITCT